MGDPGAAGVQSLAAQRAVHDRCRHPTGAFTPFRPEDIEQSVPARFEEQVRRHPGRVAVAARDNSLTYAALNRAANRVARALMGRGATPARPVALLFEHGASAIVGMLGVLKAGQPYVFLDPGVPASRLAMILDDALASGIVTGGAGAALARELMPAVPVLDIDALNAAPLEGTPAAPPDTDANPVAPIGPDSLFNLMYTSGSTGQPKAVVNNHRNVLDTVAKYTSNMRICPDDRVTQLAGGSFNTSVMSIFGALLNGAALYPFDIKAEGAARMASWLREHGITLYHSVPTAYRQLLDALTGGERLPALRAVCLGGEAVYRRDVERHRERLGPDVPLVHGFGCTELSMIRQYFIDGTTPLSDSRPPVGYPLPDREVLILDEAGRRVPPGETGEIVLRSRYLALGYWQRPELTRQAFRPDPEDAAMRRYRTGDLGVLTEDGCLTHLGRQDFQVSIRGHRIETAEIELALLESPGVREAVVTAREGRAGEQELVAYVVPAGAAAPSRDALRAEIEARLPDYMVPSAFVALSALPLTDTGKVDRRALPAPGRARELPVPPVPPRTPTERAVAAIWTDVLDLDAVGIHDEFLSLGGNSILAMRILSRIQDLLGLEIPPATLFEAPTVGGMAALLSGTDRERLDPDLVQ